MYDKALYQPEIHEDPEKLGRWLGWAQAAVVSSGCSSLSEMRDLNREYKMDEAIME